MNADIIGEVKLGEGLYNATWSGTSIRLEDPEILLTTKIGPRGTTSAIVTVHEDGTATVEETAVRVKTPGRFQV